MNIGDLVQLKSGGPIMTLGAPKGDAVFYCYWFDKDENFQSVAISIYSLVAAKEDKK